MFEEVVRCNGLSGGCYEWSPLDCSVFGNHETMNIPEDWEFVDQNTHYCPKCKEARLMDSAND